VSRHREVFSSRSHLWPMLRQRGARKGFFLFALRSELLPLFGPNRVSKRLRGLQPEVKPGSPCREDSAWGGVCPVVPESGSGLILGSDYLT